MKNNKPKKLTPLIERLRQYPEKGTSQDADNLTMLALSSKVGEEWAIHHAPIDLLEEMVDAAAADVPAGELAQKYITPWFDVHGFIGGAHWALLQARRELTREHKK
jgi:hypothetical protein